MNDPTFIERDRHTSTWQEAIKALVRSCFTRMGHPEYDFTCMFVKDRPGQFSPMSLRAMLTITTGAWQKSSMAKWEAWTIPINADEDYFEYTLRWAVKRLEAMPDHGVTESTEITQLQARIDDLEAKYLGIHVARELVQRQLESSRARVTELEASNKRLRTALLDARLSLSMVKVLEHGEGES